MDGDDSLDEFEDLDPSVLQQLTLMKNIPNTTTYPPAIKTHHTLNEKQLPPTRTHHALDENQLASYIYPTNLPIRDYQYNIVYQSLFHNVLVTLPTGLGKTFIASTVMLNYTRWFPELKVIFMAPTRPLVAQQIKACCGIAGIESSKVAILLGKARKNRQAIWDEKTVFFTTPQVVENDLTAGIIHPKLVVLLVVDEAHRAKGSYAYNNVVKFLSRFNNSFRILALTATPASDIDGVQEIVDNLHISRVEVRTERSIDTFKYLKRKEIQRITAGISEEVQEAIDVVCSAAAPILRIANEKAIYEITDPSRINAFTALDAQKRIVANPSIPEGVKWANFFILQLLVVVGQCLRRLNIYGVRAFYSYFSEKHLEFTTKHKKKSSSNKLAISFYQNANIEKYLNRCQGLVEQPDFLGHEKLEITRNELSDFFKTSSNHDSKVIIFTEFRQSALDIVRAIESDVIKPHIFIGQAKEKEKFDEEKFQRKGKNLKAPTAKLKLQGQQKQLMDLASSTGSSEMAQITGMNQKMQKELIKNFKDGIYNVLVATSIGEEGLDIGEVDLIICYDCTSSPIKNVQRMGRTGRNRDGKVILLFSGNEESKFDKAMAGYDYIQQHIMKGDSITKHVQNRIIPDIYSPKVDEVFIEIPPENHELDGEEDEDEIIKIATRYMTTVGKTGKKATSKKDKQKAPQKRFFMPDDVETGFQLVSLMLMRGRQKEIDADKKRRLMESGPDILDSFLESSDELESGLEGRKVEERVEEIVKEKAADAEKVLLDILNGDQSAPLSNTSKTMVEGLEVQSKIVVLDAVEEKRVSDFEDQNLEKMGLIGPSQTDKFEDLQDFDDFDKFDDDDEILALAQRTDSSRQKSSLTGAKVPKLDKVEVVKKAEDEKSKSRQFVESLRGRKEEIYKLHPEEGLLTKQQQEELYLEHYAPVEYENLQSLYTLKKSVGCGFDVPLSKQSKTFVEFVKQAETMKESEASNIIHRYKQSGPCRGEDFETFVEF